MFLFRKNGSDSVFHADDVRQIISAFPPRATAEEAEKNDNDGLVQCSSGDGVVQMDALRQIIDRIRREGCL